MHRSKTFLLLLFVIIFACWWGVSVLSQVSNTASIGQAQAPIAVSYVPTTTMIITHSIENGMQTYAGSFTPLSLCDNLGVGNRSNNPGVLHVSIALTLTTTAGPCDLTGEVSPEPFSVGITSDTSPVFDGVTLNGVIIPSKLVEKK